MKDDEVRRMRSTSNDRPTVRVPGAVDLFRDGDSGLRRASTGKDDRAMNVSSLDVSPSVLDMLELPESIFFARLDERVRRSQLMLVLLQTGAISHSTAGRALQAQLEAIRRGAVDLGAPQLVALLDVLGAVVGELAGLPRGQSTHSARDVLVLDENEVARDLVSLAMESAGHAVRCASTFDEMLTLFHERRPDVVLSDAELSNAPTRVFCQTLRDALGQVPIVLFASRVDDAVLAAARAADVSCCVSKEAGIEALVAKLATLFESTTYRAEEGHG